MAQQMLQELASGIDSIADMFTVSALDLSKPYKPRCLAWQDDHAQHRFVTPWSVQPVDTLHMYAQGMLDRATDQFRTLALAVPAPRIVYSPMTLARTTLAAAAQAFYLLDPAVDVRDRVRRTMNLAMVSAHARRQLIAAVDSANTAALTAADQRIQDLRTSGAQLNFTLGGQRPPFFDRPLPAETDLVDNLLSGGAPGSHGRFAYKLFSASVHAQPHIDELLLMGDVSRSRDGMSTVARTLPVTALASVVAAAAAGYVASYGRATTYFGVAAEPALAKAMDILERMAALSTP